MIYFVHMNGVSMIIKRNWIIEYIANCFLIMYSNIVNTFWTMSKPCEHVFGYARSIIREYTVKVWGNIARKLSFVQSQSKIDKTLLTVEGQRFIASIHLLENLFIKQENKLKKR